MCGPASRFERFREAAIEILRRSGMDETYLEYARLYMTGELEGLTAAEVAEVDAIYEALQFAEESGKWRIFRLF
jgi:NADH:ubiquinone oxidoreductase subunit E